MFKNIRPYNLLGIAGLLLVIVSLIVPFQSVDIHFHDTYYVFDMSYAFRNMACFLLVLFTLYAFVKQKFHSVILSWLHVILTIVTIAASILFLYKGSNAYRGDVSDSSTFQSFNNIKVATILVFVIAQVLMIVNFLIGVFKSQKQLTRRL
jgi:hypothetical protein